MVRPRIPCSCSVRIRTDTWIVLRIRILSLCTCCEALWTTGGGAHLSVAGSIFFFFFGMVLWSCWPSCRRREHAVSVRDFLFKAVSIPVRGRAAEAD
ncbi:hypothetical protein LX36DRAFT_347076 [Colletotrichum falcatum]|nr:hypothetical protein LX36DRAFT_347076 [Colletotrichum falcatum]